MTTLIANNFSVEAYLELEASSDRKHEYFKGEVFRVDGKTIQHNELLTNLIGTVGRFLKGTGCRIFPSAFRTGIPGGEAYFYPDATIVCNAVQMQPGIFDTLVNPQVVFEILDADSMLKDRGYKFFCYKEIPALQEYVLIDSTSQWVEVISREANDAWRIQTFLPENFSFTIKSIGYQVSFADLYLDTGIIPEQSLTTHH